MAKGKMPAGLAKAQAAKKVAVKPMVKAKPGKVKPVKKGSKMPVGAPMAY